MSIFSHFSVFTLTVLVALIGRISATCADRVENAPSTIGTIIRPAEECANAKAVPFGFNANSVTFLSQVFFGTAIANEVGTGQVQTVSLNFHQSKKACHCTVDDVCIATVPSAHDCAIGEYVLPVVGSTVCLRFGRSASPPLTLPSGADAAAADSMFELGGNHLILAIDGVEVTYAAIAVATTDSGKQIKALMALRGNPSNNAIFYAGCGPFIVERDAFDGDSRKRTPEFSNSATGLAVQVEQLPPVGAGGDPHLFGAHGIKFDVYGKPAANYSLLVAPAFEVNMQLADRGPEMRFMTSMAVLYQGKSFIITPWTVKTNSVELIAHFEALGAKVNIDEPNWIITIELCAQHTIAFATRHSDNINFLNLDVRVPGCHNAYGGLLGQTYQCKYAHEKFEWSREREEAFRVATLETASGMYSPLATCAHEDEYRGEAIRGGSI